MKTHVIALVFALAANAAANILIKAGMRTKAADLNQPALLMRDIVFNPLVIAGVVLFALNVISYAYVLSRIPLSVAYPVMTSGGFLIVTLASLLLLRESVTTSQVVGFFLIIAGVALVAARLR